MQPQGGGSSAGEDNRPHPRHQKGQAIVLIAIMLAVVVGMAALAIDGSRAYTLRRDLQAAVDAAALSAGDKMQQTGSYTSAEQAASSIFGINLRIYSAPSCSPGYGSPGASPLTVTCTFSDGTVLTQVVSALGAQGSQFRMSATRSLQLQFGKILTSGASPDIAGASTAGVNNLRYTPAAGALSGNGCGGAGGNAITVSGSGTLNINGDLVSNGTISVASGSVRVAGDIDARCQSTVPGSVTTACYPSGASTPCSFPDVAGATRSGFRLTDPVYPAPVVTGGSQPAPSSTVVLPAGTYTANPNFNTHDCWFLSGGVYNWQGGFTNTTDFVSNELKPPDEPVPNTNYGTLSTHQFWNTNGVNCAGAFQVNSVGGSNALDAGNFGVLLTSVRTDNYGGMNYRRESAPSVCHSVHVHNGEILQVQVSNVPGATSYNVYVSNFANGCNGPWGWVANIPVAPVVVSNSNTNPCPAFNGAGCSLGHETATFDALAIPDLFAPNPLNSTPDTYEAYPPDPETTPMSGSLPNLNPPRGPGASGDRANENTCDTLGGAYASCPNAVTPGAVAFVVPGGCLSTTNTGDTYLFSGYQYNWISIFEPPSNNCTMTMGASGNSAYVGFVYAPAAPVTIVSPNAFDSPATGGLLANTVSFSGSMPAITFSSAYGPLPPASRLTG
ncbi:MAG TPA: Tad domain-containing protein [Candidatus Dormibacteraeota bacterium]|jgi:Flp pilus assembly protein TadG